MGRLIVVNPDGDADKDRNMVQNLLGMCGSVFMCVCVCVCVNRCIIEQQWNLLGSCPSCTMYSLSQMSRSWDGFKMVFFVRLHHKHRVAVVKSAENDSRNQMLHYFWWVSSERGLWFCLIQFGLNSELEKMLCFSSRYVCLSNCIFVNYLLKNTVSFTALTLLVGHGCWYHVYKTMLMLSFH